MDAFLPPFRCAGKRECTFPVSVSDFNIPNPCHGVRKNLYLDYGCGFEFPLLSKGCYATTQGNFNGTMIHHSGLWGKVDDSGQGCQPSQGLMEVSSPADWNPYGKLCGLPGDHKQVVQKSE